MKQFILRTVGGSIHPIMGTLGARFAFTRARGKINRLLFWAWAFFLFSPVLFLMYLALLIFRYWNDIHEVFFFSKQGKARYAQILKPVTNRVMFTAIGYRIYPEELEDHIRIVTSDGKEEMKELAKKGKEMRRTPFRQFGMNVDKMTRHHIFLGTTGSGKTESIMSMFVDAVKGFSGIGMVDGKSDQMMEFKIYNLCKEYYYETQFNSIILNKPEKNTESNTYSPLLSYQSAAKASEFLGDFIGGGGGDSNSDYFANRGKVMLGNVVMYFKNRQIYYGENFSIADLSGSVKVTELNSIYYMAYAIIMDLEQTIIDAAESNSSFKKLLQRARLAKTVQNDDIANSEVLAEYLNQNSHLTRQVEGILGYKYNFFSDHYDLFVSIDSYMSGISSVWGKYAKAVAQFIYIYTKQERLGFLYTHSSPVQITYIRSVYNKFKNSESEENKAMESFPSLAESVLEEFGIPVVIKPDSSNLSSLKDALGLNDAADETIESLNADALQQHSYSEQQWSRVFGLFKQYSRVFGTPTPDVDGEDLLKNNKVLYVMLPVMELSPDQIEMLGKMFILMFKMIASVALGGDKQSATPIQFKIYQNKIKPNPVYLMVFDEIGSYMPSQGGLSILLSQVRSLRIGIFLSSQDTVSMNAKGNADEIKRISANLAKIILQHKDKDTKEIEQYIPEVDIIVSDGHIRSAVSKAKILDSGNLKLEKEKVVDLSLPSRFAKGMGLYVDGGTDEPIVFQSYYLGDNSKQALQIRRFESFDSLRNAG